MSSRSLFTLARSTATPGSVGFTTTQTTLKVLKDVGETLEKIPYVKGIAGVAIQILEIREVCFLAIFYHILLTNLWTPATCLQQGHCSRVD
jgi:hypothetical protein